MDKRAPIWLIPFSAVCVAFAFLTSGWNSGVMVWPSLWLLVAALVASNIERIERFKAGSGGVEFEARKVVQEARDTLVELQILAKQVATISLSLVKRSARIGGFPPAEEERIRGDMEILLRKTGVPNDELPAILDEWHRWVLLDYVFGILGNSMTPEGIEPVALTEWKEMRQSAFRAERPSPDQLLTWLDDHGFLDEEHRGFIEDYAFYLEYQKHRRFDVWENHADWPKLCMQRQ